MWAAQIAEQLSETIKSFQEDVDIIVDEIAEGAEKVMEEIAGYGSKQGYTGEQVEVEGITCACLETALSVVMCPHACAAAYA